MSERGGGDPPPSDGPGRWVSGFAELPGRERDRVWARGLPFHRRAPGGARAAVVALHGYGATPFEVRSVAEACAREGLDVVAPLQAGHGFRERRDQRRGFAAIDAGALLAVARAEVRACRERGYERVALFGQSMGGALALAVAAEGGVDAVATAAPAVRIPSVAVLAEALPPWLPLAIPMLKPPEPFENYFYDFHTVRSLRAIREVSRTARERLPSIACPVLVAHSRIDAVVPPIVGDLIEAEARGPVERRWFDDSGHSMTVDVARDRVAAAVATFLLRHLDEGEGEGEGGRPVGPA